MSDTAQPVAPPDHATEQQEAKPASISLGTITCPLTGEEIPPCCCPVNK